MAIELLEHPLVVDADHFATAAHAAIGQLEKFTGKPYCEHTRAVARVLAIHLDLPEVVAAGHLHDTIEDPGIAKIALEARFGTSVANLVDEVSSKASEADGNRFARVASEIRRIASISFGGKCIKCADVCVTMETIVERDPHFALTYVPEKRLLLPSLEGAQDGLLELAHAMVSRAERALSERYQQTGRRRPRPRP